MLSRNTLHHYNGTGSKNYDALEVSPIFQQARREISSVDLVIPITWSILVLIKLIALFKAV